MTSKLKRIALVTTAASLPLMVAEGAHAGGTGPLIAGAVSYIEIDDSFSDSNGFENFFDDKDVGYNFGAGWRFTKWFAADAAYWDLGSFKSDRFGDGERSKIDADAITVGAMVSAPLWLIDIYARGGAAFWDADSDRHGDDGTDPYYGVGGAINIFRTIDLYAEWVRFDLGTDLDTYNLGIRLTF
jgi:OOP family OmpA-OmpF porin